MNFSKRMSPIARPASVLALAALLASSCSSGVSKSDGTRSLSTFKMEELKAATFRLQTTDPNLSLADQNVISFSACVSDLAFLNKVIGQDFLISGGETDIKRRTNSDGCLIWTETFKFNPVAAQHDITIERTFKALNTQKGVEKVSFAVNPWTGSVVDLRYGSAPNAVPAESGVSALLGRLVGWDSKGKGKGKGDSSGDPLPKLQLDGVSGHFDKPVGRADLVLPLTLQPKVRVRTVDGQEENRDLSRVKVKITATINELSVYGSTPRMMQTELARAEQTETLGTNHWMVYLKFDHNPGELPDAARHQLHLRVEPLDIRSAQGLKAEDIAFELDSGALVSARGGMGVGGEAIRYDGAYDAYVQALSVERTGQALATAGSAAPSGATTGATSAPVSLQSELDGAIHASGVCKEAFSRGPLQFKSWRIEPNNRNTLRPNDSVPARVGVKMQVCLDGAAAYSLTPYTVSFVDEQTGQGTVRDIVTDKNSCLDFEDAVAFDYYDPAGEHWLPKTLKVSSKRMAGVSQALPVSIDPWATGSNFMWDCSVAQATDANGAAQSGPPKLYAARRPTRLFLSDFSYSFVGREFDIDKYLTLTMRRKYQVRLTPMIERTNALTGELVQQAVTSGRFKMRVLLTPDPLQEELSAATAAMKTPFLVSYEDVVDVRSGTIQTNIELPFDFQDFPRIGDRDTLYVQLTPIGDSNLQAYTGAGPFQPLGTGGSAWLFDSERSADEVRGGLKAASAAVAQLVASGKGETLRKDYKQVSSAEIFENGSGLRGFSDDQLKSLAISDADINGLVANGKPSAELAKKLCKVIRAKAKALGDNAPLVERDPTAPSKFIAFRAMDKVKGWFSGGDSKSAAPSALACTTNPEASLVTLPVRHVEEIVGKPVFHGGGTEVLGTSFSTGRDAGNSRSRSDSVSVNAGLSVSGGILPGLGSKAVGAAAGTAAKAATTVIGGATSWFGLPSIGWNAGGGWSRSWSQSQSEGTSTGISLSSGKSLWTDKLTFQIEAQVRSCVIVQPVNLALAEEYNPSKQVGLHLCATAPSRETLTETWYYVVQSFGDSPVLLRDVMVRAERPWTAAIRGEQVFADLRRAMSDQAKSVVLQPDGPSNDAETQLRAVFNEFRTLHPIYSDGAFPGTIVGK